MIKVNLSNEILRYILEIDKYRYDVSSVKFENSGKMTPWIPVNLSKGNSD